MIDALAKNIPREKVINCEIYDEDGNIDLAKVKEILLVYKKKELAMLRYKVDKTSGLKRALDQLNEVIYEKTIK